VFVDFVMNWLVLSIGSGELDNEMSKVHRVRVYRGQQRVLRRSRQAVY